MNEELSEDRPIGFMFLAQQCLEKEADQRPTAEDVLQTVNDCLQSLPDDIIPYPPIKSLPHFI